jgi:hypothetical protein
MKPMPPKDQRALLKSLEQQGCTIKETTSGWRILLPNGGTIGLHKSEGDRRSRLNLRAAILRAGLEWPLGDKTTHQRRRKSK